MFKRDGFCGWSSLAEHDVAFEHGDSRSDATGGLPGSANSYDALVLVARAHLDAFACGELSR
jgi:hypothetical protein